MSRCGTVSNRLRPRRELSARRGKFVTRVSNRGMGRMRALTGIEVKHNRRYGADCVHSLGPPETAAEIAAPHQNEGPHLAAGLRARTSANRSGARGKNDVPGKQRLTTSNEPLDPETVRLRRGSAPIPPTAIVRGEMGPVKTTLRRAKNRRGLDRTHLSAKPNLADKEEWELFDHGRLGSKASAGLPLVGSQTSHIESALKHILRF
jgi:hypothetical protein